LINSLLGLPRFMKVVGWKINYKKIGGVGRRKKNLSSTREGSIQIYYNFHPIIFKC
jgi:hypothetical protein